MSRFSRELKDFVGGFQTGQKIMDNFEEGELRKKRSALADEQLSAAKHKNSPEQRALGDRVVNARIGQIGASTNAANARSAYFNNLNQPVAPAAPITVNVPDIEGFADGGLVPERTPTREELMAEARRRGGQNQAIQTSEKLHTRPKRQALPAMADGGSVPMPRPRPIPDDWQALPPARIDNRTEREVEDTDSPRGIGEHIKAGARAVWEGQRYRDRMQEHPSSRDSKNPLYDRRTKKVPNYEDGGMVEDDDDDGVFDTGITAAEEAVLSGAGDAYAQATPAQAAPAQAAPRQALPMREPTMPAPRAPRAAQPPRQMPSLAQRRAGAAPPDQVKEVEAAVKAAYGKKYGDKLSPSYLKVLTLGSVYKHFYDQGDTQSAERVRGQLAQAYFMESDRASAVARAAIQGGDPDGAAKAMTQAYAAIPSGVSFVVEKKGDGYAYRFTDEKSGEEITKGIWSPIQLAAKALQMSEAGAETLLLGSAKIKKGAEGKKERGGEKPSEVKTRVEMMGGSIPAENTGTGEAPEKGAPSMDHRSIANELMHDNKLLPADAVKFSQMLLDPSQKPRVTQDKEGNAIYSFKGSPRVRVTPDLIERITELKQLNAPSGDVPIGSSRAADDPVAEQPGVLSEAGRVAGGVADQFGQDFKDWNTDRQPRAIEAEKRPRRGGRAIVKDEE